MASHYLWRGKRLLLFCHLQSKASHTAFAGLYGERIKIRSGENSRQKTLSIEQPTIFPEYLNIQ